MTFYMLSFRPDFARLMGLAAKERLLPPGGDLGYALHAVFVASFGDLAPKPVVLLPPGAPGGGPAGRLLAYARHPLDDLVAHANTFADPVFSRVLDLSGAEDKVMPSAFPAGARLGFRARLRPTIRTGKPRPSEDGRVGKARERDVYEMSDADTERQLDGRQGTYVSWLAQHFTKLGGATLESAALESFCRTRLMTRDRGGETPKATHVEGPDAVIVGHLRVEDGATFGALLERGIGRHRAFGFGMLLLRPVGS